MRVLAKNLFSPRLIPCWRDRPILDSFRCLFYSVTFFQLVYFSQFLSFPILVGFVFFCMVWYLFLSLFPSYALLSRLISLFFALESVSILESEVQSSCDPSWVPRDRLAWDNQLIHDRSPRWISISQLDISLMDLRGGHPYPGSMRFSRGADTPSLYVDVATLTKPDMYTQSHAQRISSRSE